jgi:hypothetical protein
MTSALMFHKTRRRWVTRYRLDRNATSHVKCDAAFLGRSEKISQPGQLNHVLSRQDFRYQGWLRCRVNLVQMTR